jgi:uncharacterized protein (TIGR03435 family)
MGAGRMIRTSRWTLPLLLAIFASTPYAQEPRTAHVNDASAALPEFEVASVKPTDLRGEIIVGTSVYPGGRVKILGCELQALIRIAFHLTTQRITGGAAWTDQIKYDVEALAPKELAITDLRYNLFEISDERLRQMLQALLIRRFQLESHTATESADVYILQSGGGKPGFHETSAANSSTGHVRILWNKRQLALDAATMPQLAKFLSGVLGAPVLDQTGLTGRFDYTPERADPDSPDPSVDMAAAALNFVRELHLKLQRTKGPVESFVIDGAEKPSPN